MKRGARVKKVKAHRKSQQIKANVEITLDKGLRPPTFVEDVSLFLH